MIIDILSTLKFQSCRESENIQLFGDEAQKMNISHLIAEISSENNGSISFHEKHGYALVGELHDIGEKFGRKFGIVYMQKTL